MHSWVCRFAGLVVLGSCYIPFYPSLSPKTIPTRRSNTWSYMPVPPMCGELCLSPTPVRADLTYGSSSQPESKQNPMDVLTSAGFAIPSCILMVMICESWIRCAVTHSSRKAPSDCLFNYICPMYYTCCICSTRTAKVSANNNKDLHLASPPMCWKRLLRTTCNSVQFVGTG